jgi:hypothetical protein
MVNIDSDDVQIDREELILRRENPTIKADREALNAKLGKAIMKHAFGTAGVMMILSTLLLMGGLYFGLMMLVNYFRDKVFSVLPLCITLVALILGGVFALIRKKLEKKSEENSPIDALDDSFARINEISRRDLGVPDGIDSVQIFGYFYDEENTPSGAYDVDEVGVFVEEGKLCLHHVDVVIGIPLESIEGIVKCHETVTFKDWICGEDGDEEGYLQYGIEKKQIDEYNEEYSMNGYYSLRFSLEGTPMEMILPLYNDIEPLLSILNLEVSEEASDN